MPNYQQDIVKEILADFSARQQMRRPFELVWQLNMNFLMGNQYCQIGKTDIEQQTKFYFWQQLQVFNHIAPIVETRISRLNRVRPHTVARPFSASDSDIASAKVATKILDSAQEKLSLDQLITQATAWSEICGTSFYKVSWNNLSQDVEVSVCSPFEIYPDSNTGALTNCNSIIHAKVYSSADVKTMYGVDVKGQPLKVFDVCGQSGFSSVTRETKPNQVLVIERYTRPTSDAPNGKLQIVAGNTLVYSGDMPYLLGENNTPTYPFVRQVSTEVAGCFWGTSVVERLIPVQRAYNAVKNRKHEFLNRLCMGVLTVEDGSVDTDNLEEEGLSPGKILVYRQGATKPSYMENNAVPTDFGEEEDRLLNEFTTVSGVSEFAGNSLTPSGASSGTALQLIAEQDEIRLSNSIDSVKNAIKQVSKYILRLYKQFVQSQKLIRYTGGNTAEVFYFCGSEISSDDIVFETENQLTDSPTTRRTMIFDLLNAGVLSDENGNLPTYTKTKILSMLGFGDWQTAQDMAQLHTARAQRENLDIASAQVLDVDDHALHIAEHTRFIVSNQDESFGKDYRKKLLSHITEHKSYLSKN